MNTSAPSQPGRRRRWLRTLVYAAGGFALLLVAAYFVVTSSAFFKGVILPRAGKAVGGQITVAEASISPFTQVHLRGLKVQTTGAEPLLQVEEIRVRYSLRSILGGTMKVDEITVATPVVQIVENADGSSNLDPLLQAEEQPAAEPSPKPAAPPQVDLRNLALKNVSVRYTKHLKGGGSEIVDLTGINVTLDQLKNGQAGKLTSEGVFKFTRPTNDVIEVRNAGAIEFTLGDDLMPRTLQARIEEEILRAGGAFRELSGYRMAINGDVTPGEVKELTQRFYQRDQLLGELKLTGPLDLAKREGRLKLEVSPLDRRVLNLIGAPLGMDFGPTTLNATIEIALTQGGSVIAADSRLNATRLSVTQNGRSTPPLDVQLVCALTVDATEQIARLQSFTLSGMQNQKQLLRGNLAQPMTIPWGPTASTASDAALELTVTDFNFADWKPFVGEAVSGGRLSLRLNVLSQQGGNQLKLGLVSQVADLAADLGDTALTNAALTLKLDGQVNDFSKMKLSDYRLELTRQSLPALTVTGTAAYDGVNFNLQTQFEAVMARLLGSGPTTPLTAGLRLDGTFTNQMLDLRYLQLALSPTQRAPTNELAVSGQFDLSNPDITKGQLTAKAETLDLTALYDAFAAPAATPATPTGKPGQPPPPAPAESEPESVTLPVQLTAEANLGRVYLREIALENCQVTARVDGGKVTLDPCQLTLNGAPVKANVDLNLGVKGYTYALALNLDQVPLEPIANSFSPQTRGQYQGLILAHAQIQGAGVTGASLRKNLSGRAGFTFTNANLQLIGPKSKRLIVPIATLLRVNEITQSPLNWLDARTEIGGGNITLSRFAAQSEAFEASAQGVIPIAEVLTNSPLDLPVEFALRRSLAEKASLLPPNTPPDARYATLPRFVTVKGTLGEPKADLNEMALSGLLLKTGVGIAEKLGVKVDTTTGNLLQGVGNLLTGQRAATTNQVTTNAPGTNAVTPINPLDLLRRRR